jgi:hypothetical protein
MKIVQQAVRDGVAGFDPAEHHIEHGGNIVPKSPKFRVYGPRPVQRVAVSSSVKAIRVVPTR